MLGRSRQSATESTDSSPAAAKPGGKGRPTPKRREAERGRRRAMAPKDRKEAYRAMRERQRAERAKSMQALRTGDERNLPPRDRGPVRRYARDLVDARRSVAEFFLPAALVIFILTLSNQAQLELAGSYLWLMLVVLIIVDSVLIGLRLRQGLRRSFPDENHKGALPYALMRSMQIRRFRLPPARVRPGRRRR